MAELLHRIKDDEVRLPNCSKHVFLCKFFFSALYFWDYSRFIPNQTKSDQGTSYIPISKANDIPTTKVNISCQQEGNHNTVGKTKVLRSWLTSEKITY